MRLVAHSVVVSRHFIDDFIASIRNVFGFRLKEYEAAANMATQLCFAEFQAKYPEAINAKLDIESGQGNTIMVTVYAELHS